MASKAGRTGLFVAGLVLGAAVAAGLFAWHSDATDKGAPAPAAGVRAVGTPAAASAQVQADCSFPPLLASAGGNDGKLSLKKELAGQPASAVAAAIVSGKEAAASGRQRDAEIAFLTACRTAESMKQPDALLVADAMYQLGRHYATVARPEAARRGELLDRSARLYGASLRTYRARHGEQHEKTRFASEGLATVQAARGGTRVAGATQAPATAPATAPAAAPAKRTEPMPEKKAPGTPPEAKPELPAAAPVQQAEPRAMQPAPGGQARSTRPSFDCSRGRSAAETLICQDEELAAMDRELARLHARAKSASPNPREFQRRSDAAWSRRESECADRECVRQWYGERRAQLQRQSARPAPPPPAAPAQASGDPHQADVDASQ
ncbi:MAG TPA: hypothetical protein VLK85_12035 [Ramlibacter sp.]|nr:hypothetical protein [Ramlibacter sp.]